LRLLAAALVLLLALQAWYAGWVLAWRWVTPGPTAFMRQDLERAREAAGGRPPRGQQQHWVPYARIGLPLKQAVVAAEDARFVEHGGVDWDAMLGAWRNNGRRGHLLHGGSTITQQLAKNLFLSPRRSYLRKAQELVIALMIEACWNKRRILEVYLNVVEWGDGIYGAEAAARRYFGISAAALSPEQAARLAVMLPAPRYFERHAGGAYLGERSQVVGARMAAARVP
jgi:monofunctional biosynthetic peptidoglycan transglycosylase